jgi:hypothetical protein
MADDSPRPDGDADDTDSDETDSELPADVIERAVRLTRLAREAVDDNEAEAYRQSRAELLADHDFTARVRSEDNDVLVLYPVEWVEDDVVVPERIDDIDRGVERPLEGPGDADDWATVDDHNQSIVATVQSECLSVHGANAQALADFMSNHYAKPIEDATSEELREFLDEYFPRNAWPTDKQRQLVEESLEHVYERTDVELPLD